MFKTKSINNTICLQLISKQNYNRLYNSFVHSHLFYMKEFHPSLVRRGRTAEWKVACCIVLAEAETQAGGTLKGSFASV